jgi:hypothetical protein
MDAFYQILEQGCFAGKQQGGKRFLEGGANYSDFSVSEVLGSS